MVLSGNGWNGAGVIQQETQPLSFGMKASVLAVCGGLIGVVTRLAEQVDCCWGIGSVISTFGDVSQGLFLWAVLCTAIAVSARTKTHAAAGVLSFLAAMIVSYCALPSRLLPIYPPEMILVVARFFALGPAALAATAAWHLRRSALLRKFAILPAALCVLFDVTSSGVHQFGVLMMDGALFIVFLFVLRYAAEQGAAERNAVPLYRF